jgi:hypothetical protein
MKESPKKWNWGRAWLFLAPVGLWHMSRDTFRSVKETFARSTNAVRGAGAARQVRMDWNATVVALGVTGERIAREVARRQAMAAIAACFGFVGIYGVFAWQALLPGLGCAALASLYYIQAVLRLHQIRNHEFISVRVFFSRVANAPREALPLGLPKGWKLYDGPKS